MIKGIKKIELCMGKSKKWEEVPGLSEEDIKTLNGIGYGTIKDKGSISDYLESLNNGYAYCVKCIEENSFEYTEILAVAYFKISE